MVRCALALGVLLTLSAAADGPQPPCGSEVLPPYPEVDQPPVIKAWENSRDWKPPQCTGWEQPGYSTLVATVGRIHFPGGREGLLHRIGAISDLKGLRYWSTTHQQWRTLIVDAAALSGPPAGQLTEGARITFEQEDSLSGRGTYELHMLAVSPDRLVFDTRNLSTLRFMMMPIFHPGEIQSIYFLDRESKDIWRYYNLARIGKDASSLAAGHIPSAINRAVAFYRHLAGIPVDQEPPAAR